LRESCQLKCTWKVFYVRRDGFNQVQPEDLAWQIKIRKPPSLTDEIISTKFRIIDVGTHTPSNAECDCLISPQVGKFPNLNTSSNLVHKIEVDLQNLKVEEIYFFCFEFVFVVMFDIGYCRCNFQSRSIGIII
jgi:hypothetical protein